MTLYFRRSSRTLQNVLVFFSEGFRSSIPYFHHLLGMKHTSSFVARCLPIRGGCVLSTPADAIHTEAVDGRPFLGDGGAGDRCWCSRCLPLDSALYFESDSISTAWRALLGVDVTWPGDLSLYRPLLLARSPALWGHPAATWTPFRRALHSSLPFRRERFTPPTFLIRALCPSPCSV